MYNGEKLNPKQFIEESIAQIKEQVGGDTVVLGLSGGVDSTVTALLVDKAIGHKLVCIFVDHGLLRKNEFEEVLAHYEGMGLNVIGVRAADRFFAACKGITDPELKRKAIGKTFIDVFADEARKVKDAKWLAQGTIWPDIAESFSDKGTIKSHHNVGGLPEDLGFELAQRALLGPPSLPRTRPGRPLPRRTDAGAHPHPPGGGCRLHRRTAA